MIWGLRESHELLKKNNIKKFEILFGFNEPDSKKQSNISVSEAIKNLILIIK